MSVVSFPETGLNDATDLLNEGLDLLPNGKVVDIGTRVCEGTILVRSKPTIAITAGTLIANTQGHHMPSYNSDIYHWPRHRSAVRVDDVDCGYIRMGVRGPNYAAGVNGPSPDNLSAQHAFDIHNSGQDGGIDLDGVSATQVYGDFVYVRDDSNVRVRNFHFLGNGRQGFSMVAGSNMLVEDGLVGNVRHSVFDLEPGRDYWTVDGFRARRVRVGNHRLNLLAAKGRGIVRNVLLEDITGVLTGSGYGMRVQVQVVSPVGYRRDNFTLRRITGYSPYGSTTGAAIRFKGVDNVKVEQVVQELQGKRNMALVLTEDCGGLLEMGPGNEWAEGVQEWRNVA